MTEHDHLLDPTPKPPPSPWNVANALTVLRILMVPVYGWLLLAHHGDDPVLRFWAAGVFLLATLTDRVDGEIARRRGLITDFGKVADPIADKALMGMAFVGLSVLGELPWWVTALVLIREWGVTALRFFVIRHGVMPAGRGGKLKTVLQSVTAHDVLAAAVGVPGARRVDGRCLDHHGAGRHRDGRDGRGLRPQGAAPAPDE